MIGILRQLKSTSTETEISQTGTQRDYKNLIWGSVLDGSFQPKG